MANLGGLAVEFQLTGDKETDQAFTELPRQLQKKILRRGVRAGAKILLDQAKTNVPKVSGAAAASLKVRAGKRSRSTPNTVAVNVITAAGWFKGSVFYLAFGELGFKLGSRKSYSVQTKDGRTVTRYKLGKRWIPERIPVSGKRWITQALDQRGDEARRVALTSIATDIRKEAERLGRGK